MRDLGFAIVWAVLFPVTFWSAHVGVLLWIWVALLSPNERLYGFMSEVPFNKIVAIVTLLLVFFNNQKKKFYVDTTVGLIFLLIVVATLAAIFPQVSDDDGQFLYEKLLKEFALALTIITIMWDRQRLTWTIWALSIGLGYTAAVEGLEYVVSGGAHRIVSAFSIGDNNSIALAVLMNVPLVFYLRSTSAVRSTKLVLLGLMVISIICVIGTNSRGGFIGLVLLFIAMVLRSKNKLPPIALGVIGAVLLFALAPASWFERMNTIQDAGENTSFLGRVVAWKISTMLALDHPLFGAGFHGVQRWANWQLYRNNLGLFSFIPTPEPDIVPHAAHSIYFEVLGDLGFTGLAAFMAILLTALYNCQVVISRTRNIVELQWAALLARMLQISIVIYMAAGALLSMGYYEGFWVVIAIISRLRRTTADLLAERAASGDGRAAGLPQAASGTSRAAPDVEVALARLMP